MTNEQIDYPLCGKWVGRYMNGEWYGEGKWFEEGKWMGHGIFQGGMLNGTWKGEGKWEPLGKSDGNWNGSGEMTSPLPFPSNVAMILIAIVGLISNIAQQILGLIGWGTYIVNIVVIFTLLVMLAHAVRKEALKGKWSGTGFWNDDGEFRILKMTADWNIGPHNGTLSGEMKNTKPKY